MADFKPLCKPEEIKRNRLGAPEPIISWYVETVDSFTKWRRSGTPVHYLRNDGGGPDVFPHALQGNKAFWFDSELDAHVAACDYYTKHGERYPYLDEMMELGNINSNGFTTGDVESQVMDFI